jgi:hypothetical protein
VKLFRLIVSVLALTIGLGAIALGVARYRLPYENARYFDPQTSVVYHQQSAELYLLTGIALVSVGLVLTVVSFRAQFLRAQ